MIRSNPFILRSGPARQKPAMALRSMFARLFAALALLTLVVQPAMAQSILRDAETEALLKDMSRDLIIAAGLDPNNVNIVMIGDDSINAFVAGTQDVYIHSGLMEAASNANEVQGVIAHELGHIAGGHAARRGDAVKGATGITLLSLLLGAAAIAAGAGEAGIGILGAGQQAALGNYLAYSRTEESSADLAGARFLSAAGITGRGSLEFFKKLQNQEFRLAIKQDDSFGRSHPLSGDRINVLREVYVIDPAWDAAPDKNIEARFQRVKAKLKGFVGDPTQTLRAYPETDNSVPAHYARAYAWHKSAYPEKAIAEADALIAVDPDDPYFLELQGQILLESGRPADAVAPLRKAVFLTNNAPLIAGLFGHALIASEDPNNFAEAERVLKAAVSQDPENPFAWYQLGIVYANRGDEPRAQLASAERYMLQGSYPLALRSADGAMAGLPNGSYDWIRAEDISIQSRQAIETANKRR